MHSQRIMEKAINATDDFVTMYKQRKPISSMSNHIHLFHAVFSVDVYKLQNGREQLQ